MPFVHILMGLGPLLNQIAELEGLWNSLWNEGLPVLCSVMAHPPFLLTIQHGVRNLFHISLCLLSYHKAYLIG